MRRIVVSLTLISLFLHGGCGLVARMGTPTRHETKISAEYKLGEHKKEKILVLVEQPGWLGAEANLRYHLTEAINKRFIKRVKIRGENVVGYDELAEFRSRRANFSRLWPEEVAKGLGAKLVLLVRIEKCQLNQILRSGFYKGSLHAKAILIDAASGDKLWPKDADSKTVKVGFEVESKGKEAAVKTLAAAAAHCITRCFYDCRKDKFKIAEERVDSAWDQWE